MRNRQGMSLIEVLTAAVVMALVGAGLFPSVSGYFNATATALSLDKARQDYISVVEELKATPMASIADGSKQLVSGNTATWQIVDFKGDDGNGMKTLEVVIADSAGRALFTATMNKTNVRKNILPILIEATALNVVAPAGADGGGGDGGGGCGCGEGGGTGGCEGGGGGDGGGGGGDGGGDGGDGF